MCYCCCRPPGPEPLPTPAAPTLSDATSDGFTVTFATVAGADGYVVRVCKVGTEICTTQTATASPVVITGLDPATQYDVSIQATDSTGTAGPSGWSDAATLDTTAIPVPANLAVVGTPTATAITVQWDAVAQAASYVVRYRTGSDAYTTIPVASGTTVEITGLTASTPYDISIKAIAAVNSPFADSPYSTDIQATTAAAA